MGGLVGRLVGEIKNKANLSPAELELGLSLAKNTNLKQNLGCEKVTSCNVKLYQRN